ncbi:apolipoprotein D-like [Lycorma delicatula]|uniref:apolipoprotein D-like n=1 Tax=Lycorma delicatula TaxID=130591 RepID=UPI003F519D41
MSKNKLHLVVILTLSNLFYLVEGRFITGSCPTLLTVEGFNLTEIEGKWYEIKLMGSFFETVISRCNSMRFTDKSNDSFTIDYNRIVWPNRIVNNKGFARYHEDGEFSKFFLTLDVSGITFETLPYSILAVIPDKYLIMWSCIQLPLVNLQRGAVLSRSRTLNENLMAEIHDTLLYNGLNPKKFIKIKQTDCLD